ncbi:uncharacterized protein LOC106640746 [Copidosoma floridanum]|uniref:uncharacterized protein LOC106640746 n=1 Tax=Copidosoma floridanum TaxID=29053 RepID=UPI0006C9E04F|nr:uncharacterized protein LOC106640746 [Copidosoma floridanum]
MTGLRSQRTWWEGPAWLAEDVDSWPLDRLPAPNQHSSICCVVQQLDASYLEQFSNLRMLLSFLVRIRRFVRSRLGRGPVLSVASPLTPTKLHDAFLACVCLSQARLFSADLQCLRRGERLRKTNLLVPLAAFLDDDGILRVGGRLEHSPLTYEERHPLILSGASSLASMVIAWAHSRALHGGYRVTTAYVCKRAWLLSGPRRIKAHFRRCVVCIRLRARLATQLMAPLPSSRVSSSRAFACTGVDYAGPFHVLSARGRGVRTTKGYIAVFVSLATKALHLELVGDLSAASFLGTLHRFAGRRGRPGVIWSDNATCFRRADVELRDALLTAELDWGLVAGSLADQGIAWKFIPPGAPHFGGLWEATVKSTKSHLRCVMGSRHLTYEEFSTVLVGIEMVLNSRPLTPLSGDTGDLDVLTPGHFLVSGPLNSIVLPGPLRRAWMRSPTGSSFGGSAPRFGPAGAENTSTHSNSGQNGLLLAGTSSSAMWSSSLTLHFCSPAVNGRSAMSSASTREPTAIVQKFYYIQVLAIYNNDSFYTILKHTIKFFPHHSSIIVIMA